MGMLEQTSWNSNGSTGCGGMCWNLLEFHHLLESIAYAGIPLRWTVLDSINGSPGTCWNSCTLEFPSWNPA